MDVHLAVIKDAVEAAKDYLLEARYHKNMLRFLCCEMEKVADLLPQLPKDASQEFLVVLKDEMEKGSLLISRHGRRFDLRGFYKVGLVSRSVEQMCIVFRECLHDLGLDDSVINIETKLDADSVTEDERYLCWYLTCILECRCVDRQIPDTERKELEEQVARHRDRMQVVTMIPEGEVRRMEEIGEGGYGKVFKGVWKNTAVAIKMLRNDLTPESRAEFLSEVELHIQLNHSNVVRCFGAMASNCIVMELASTDLKLFYQKEGDEWKWPMKLHLMLSACFGLQHLHKSRIIHGDVKTENFLVFNTQAGGDVVIKITDFGLAATKTETRSKTAFPMAGTFLWMAPELNEGAAQTFSADVFSMGLVLFEIAGLSPPYRGLRSNNMVQKRKVAGKNPVPIPDDCPEAVAGLMKRCIAPAACERPRMDQVCTELEEALQQYQRAKPDAWSKQEDEQILELHKKYGNKWTEIARRIGRRTDNAVKARYQVIVRRDEETKSNSGDMMDGVEAASTRDNIKNTSLERVREELQRQERKRREQQRLAQEQKDQWRRDTPCPAKKKMAEMVNEMGDVSMRFSSVSDDKAEVSEIKDYTAQPHGSPPVNKDGDIPLCVFPSAESLLETLRRSCTPTAHESGGIQAAPPVPRAPPAPVDVWQGQPVLSEEHKRLLKRLFTVDKEGSMEPGQMDVQMDVVPVSCPVEFDPTRLEQHCEPSGGNVSLDGRPMFSGLADEMPESPFVSQVEAPPLPSPSDIPPLGPISPSGVQLSPIFSQVNLESLLSVMGSFTSSDLVDFINTSGIRMVDVSESNLPPPAPMDED